MWIASETIIDEIIKRKIDLIIIHTGQHYDKEMSDNLFTGLEIPAPNYNINVGYGSHGKQTALRMEGMKGYWWMKIQI